jgi:hypothetical protein
LNAARNLEKSTCSVVVAGGLSAWVVSESPLQPLATIATALRPAVTTALRDTEHASLTAAGLA